MFCYQCQEAAMGAGCNLTGVCGKKPELAKLQDLLIYAAKGLAAVSAEWIAEGNPVPGEAAKTVRRDLVMTAVNVNYDASAIRKQVTKTRRVKRELLEKLANREGLPEAALWDDGEAAYELMASSPKVSILTADSEDIIGLRELVIYGLKGISAYLEDAGENAPEDAETDTFLLQALAKTAGTGENFNELVNLVLKTGQYAYRAMERLDQANTARFGEPVITRINRVHGVKPGILIAGSDLGVAEEVLRQTAGTGIEVYAHGEMMTALTYPHFREYPHFVGSYGGAWWREKEDFDCFGGPVIVAGDAMVPPGASYETRLYTAGAAGFPGCRHLERRSDGSLDLTEVIEQAKNSPAPRDTAPSAASAVGGFGRKRMAALSDMILDDVRSQAIRGFLAVVGDDGRSAVRKYYTELAEKMPARAVILAAGSVKYRFEDLGLGDILGIQRLTDMGQSGDCYSLIQTAMNFKAGLNLEDINDLPFTWLVSWNDQRSIANLLALLYLGIRDIYLGPTMPAFITRNVMSVLENTFDLHETTEAERDLKEFFPEDGETRAKSVKPDITKDMLVSDIVRRYPDVVPTLLACGLNCLTCGASAFETLEEACQVHGIPVDEVLEAIQDDPMRD
jgi:hydroxylamine reductase